MSFRKRLLRSVLGLYLGATLISNPLAHVANYLLSRDEVEKPYYGKELKKEWESFGEIELSKILSARDFIPFYACFSFDKPPAVSMDNYEALLNQGIRFEAELGKDGKLEIRVDLIEQKESSAIRV